MDIIQVRKLMVVMVVSVTNGTQMVSPQLWVLPKSSGMLGVLCTGATSLLFVGLACWPPPRV